MKQWIKYTAVVCCFFMMVVLFFPYSGSDRVIASEGGTVSGGNVTVASEEGEDETSGDSASEGEGVASRQSSWTVNVKYELDGGTFSEEINQGYFNGTGEWVMTYTTTSGQTTGYTVFFASDMIPQKAGYLFAGWSCNVDGKIYQPGEDTGDNNLTYAIPEVTFTAQWTTKSVTVRYVADGGSFNDSSTEKTETITSTDDATDFSINIISDVPEQDGYDFDGWKCGVNDTIYQSGSETTFSWTDYVGGEIVFTAQWTWTGSEITNSSTYTLNAGQPYTLGNGTWTVVGDNSNSSYSGGIQFYVPNSGSYTFNLN